MKEIVLTLTRAALLAKHEGRKDDARRLNNALAALLTLDVESDEPTAAGPHGTKLGIGVAA